MSRYEGFCKAQAAGLVQCGTEGIEGIVHIFLVPEHHFVVRSVANVFQGFHVRSVWFDVYIQNDCVKEFVYRSVRVARAGEVGIMK